METWTEETACAKARGETLAAIQVTNRLRPEGGVSFMLC